MNIRPCESRPVLSPCTLKDIDYQVDPYIGCEHYCYYCYVLPQAETDWTKEILIHENIVGQLDRELDNIPPQNIYMGYHTDPYQPCEAEYLQTRKVLELLLQKGFSATILTKSDLVVRDIDILKEMKDSKVSASVAFNDNKTRRLFEADTMDTERRIDALYQMREADIETGALICPVIPYITNAIELIKQLEPCTEIIRIYSLSINDHSDQNWLNIEDILKHQYPHLIGQIEPAIFSTDHMYWRQLREILISMKNERQLIRGSLI
ncbi:MAG: radical SAM protein [Planctomycetes bacterium]|nr:radical SAM protein [Planctomycetota bacterium]